MQPLRHRLITSIVLSVPVIAMAMIPPLQFTNWQWLSLVLAAPVVVYAGWPFHKAAWSNLRHGAATMDTLISIGTIAALGWSLWALFFGTAAEPTHGRGDVGGEDQFAESGRHLHEARRSATAEVAAEWRRPGGSTPCSRCTWG